MPAAEAVISCCGIRLPVLEAETPDDCEIKALYPEWGAEARFFFRGSGWLYFCCNRHGLFRQKVESLRAAGGTNGRRDGNAVVLDSADPFSDRRPV